MSAWQLAQTKGTRAWRAGGDVACKGTGVIGDRRIGLFQWDMREKRGLLASTGMSTQDAVSAVAPSRPAIYVQRSSIVHNDFHK